MNPISPTVIANIDSLFWTHLALLKRSEKVWKFIHEAVFNGKKKKSLLFGHLLSTAKTAEMNETQVSLLLFALDKGPPLREDEMSAPSLSTINVQNVYQTLLNDISLDVMSVI